MISPDFNINDLAFFRSLACAVSKVRRGKVDYDVDKLAADVRKAWYEYDDEKVTKMWKHLRFCLKGAIDFKGAVTTTHATVNATGPRRRRRLRRKFLRHQASGSALQGALRLICDL